MNIKSSSLGMNHHVKAAKDKLKVWGADAN